MIKGSCLCGGIRFEIDGEIMMSRYYHCENCRKFSGTAQAAWETIEGDLPQHETVLEKSCDLADFRPLLSVIELTVRPSSLSSPASRER